MWKRELERVKNGNEEEVNVTLLLTKKNQFMQDYHMPSAGARLRICLYSFFLLAYWNFCPLKRSKKAGRYHRFDTATVWEILYNWLCLKRFSFLRFLNCYNPLLKYIQIFMQLPVFCSLRNLMGFRTKVYSKIFDYYRKFNF
jgi:hypothetical protein